MHHLNTPGRYSTIVQLKDNVNNEQTLKSKREKVMGHYPNGRPGTLRALAKLGGARALHLIQLSGACGAHLRPPPAF